MRKALAYDEPLIPEHNQEQNPLAHVPGEDDEPEHEKFLKSKLSAEDWAKFDSMRKRAADQPHDFPGKPNIIGDSAGFAQRFPGAARIRVL